MSDETETPKTTLSDDDIITKRDAGRRRFLGIMAVGSVGAALVPSQAAAADADSGVWNDVGSCPRGPVRTEPTGFTDADSGVDRSGYGRGTPRC